MSNPFRALKSRYFIFCVFIFSSLIVGLLYALLSITQILPWPHEDPLGTPLLFMVIFGTVCGTIYGGGRKFDLKLRYLFGPAPVRLPLWYLLLLVVCVLLFSFSSFSLIFYPVSLIAPRFVAQQLSEQLLQVNTVLPALYQSLMVFVTVIFAPLAEEFIFRGILLQRWSFKWGLRTGIVLSSMLFGALHVNNPVGLTMFGLVMALLYIRTNSLWTPIIAHTLNNLLSVLPELLTSNTETPTMTLEDFQNTWWIGLIFLGLSAPVLTRFIRQSWPRPGAPLPYMVNARYYR